jgi:hypothetical protein
MLCIRRHPKSGKPQFWAAPKRIKLHESDVRAHTDHPPILLPRIVQTGCIPFNMWRQEHAYFVECMMRCLRIKLGGLTTLEWDWVGVRVDLERYLYCTSATRHRGFALLK